MLLLPFRTLGSILQAQCLLFLYEEKLQLAVTLLRFHHVSRPGISHQVGSVKGPFLFPLSLFKQAPTPYTSETSKWTVPPSLFIMKCTSNPPRRKGRTPQKVSPALFVLRSLYTHSLTRSLSHCQRITPSQNIMKMLYSICSLPFLFSLVIYQQCSIVNSRLKQKQDLKESPCVSPSFHGHRPTFC